MSEKADFITTIADLKKYIKEAEEEMGNAAINFYRFRIHLPLRNTGGEGGFGQHEESGELFVGEINLNRERLEKKAMLNLSNEAGKIIKQTEDN